MILQLGDMEGPIKFSGTIEDGKMLLCFGASGRPFATGVFVCVRGFLNLIMLPVGRADAVSAWAALINSEKPRQFGARLMKFCRDTDGEAHWEITPDDCIQIVWPSD
jgi:hypothetical protein